MDSLLKNSIQKDPTLIQFGLNNKQVEYNLIHDG